MGRDVQMVNSTRAKNTSHRGLSELLKNQNVAKSGKHLNQTQNINRYSHQRNGTLDSNVNNSATRYGAFAGTKTDMMQT